MEIIIKRPIDCTEEELIKFRDLVVLGEQVQQYGLLTRIRNCKALGIFLIDNEMVGVSAIKQPDNLKTRSTMEQAMITNRAIPEFELGYSVTKKDFRGQKINSKLNDRLLEVLSNNDAIYATTGNEAMRSYLQNRGFEKVGISFNGNYNEVLDYYEITISKK